MHTRHHSHLIPTFNSHWEFVASYACSEVLVKSYVRFGSTESNIFIHKGLPLPSNTNFHCALKVGSGALYAYIHAARPLRNKMSDFAAPNLL
jgi:hypothetical protein